MGIHAEYCADNGIGQMSGNDEQIIMIMVLLEKINTISFYIIFGKTQK